MVLLRRVDVMVPQLVETILPHRERVCLLVPRPRLLQRLDEGADRRLTLVSAPAGFGKTRLLAEWVGAPAGGGRSAAWLSLDQGDNDLELSWTYVITALQTVRPGVGECALSLLRSPQPPLTERYCVVLQTLTGEVQVTAGLAG